MANNAGRGSGTKTKSVGKANSSRKKGGSAPNKTDKAKRDDRHYDEIFGILLSALGIILGIVTYVPSEALFGAVVNILFGLLGILAYALPVILLVAGIIAIAIPKQQIGTGLISMSFGTVYCVMCIIHIAVVNPTGIKFSAYFKNAYSLGAVERTGGGILAAVPAYGVARLITAVGAIVFFVAIAVVLVMLITRVSIRAAGKKVIERVELLEDKRKARLYNESLLDEPEREPLPTKSCKRPKKRKRRDRELYEADLLDSASQNCNGKSDATPLGASTAQGEIKDVSLDLLPRSGKLPTVKKKQTGSAQASELKPGFNISDAGLDFDKASVDTAGYAKDPFDAIEIVPEDNITGDKPLSIGIEDGSVVEMLHEDEAARDTTAPQKAERAAAGDIAPTGAEGMDIPPAVKVYQRPPLSLLRMPDHSEAIAGESPSDKARLLISTLASFNISATITNISVGPVITRFELQPAQGIRVNRITTLSNDIALALAAPRVRIEAPIPGKAAIGVEIPNKDTAMVRLREVIDTREFTTAASPLTFALGKDIAGKPVMANLEKMPHMLIAGATGSGKSVCINGIILSLAYKSSPDDVRMILIDPKVVELSIFAPLPHLFCSVVTDPKKAAGVLKWAVMEMEQRYAKMGKVNARDLARYNALQEKAEDKWPRLVVIIDELADLMMVASKDVEESICRIAQLGRACGIHLIVATQRPSVDVITGLIKANIPSRIAFAVSNPTDSRVIMDTSGAEKLLGRGDMLFHANGAAKPIRAQGAYVGDDEVEGIMAFFKEHSAPTIYDENAIAEISSLSSPTGQGNGKQEDELLPDAVRIVIESGSASISMIQRRLRVGYARAARLVDIMEQQKLVSGFDGSKPRKVLIDEAGYMRLFGGARNADSADDELQ